MQSYTSPPEGPASDGYDGNDNPIYSVDGNGPNGVGVGTEQQFDPLNRLVKILRDHTGQSAATKDATTQFAYDARDNLRSTTDPDNLTTSYTYDGLNNLTALSSPDTGTTGYSYDAAGNRQTQTDARMRITTYSYDPLNRVIGITYPTASLNIAYTYDQTATGCYNIRRLTKITDSSGTTTYCYDQRGNVLSKVQITNGVTLTTGYTYTLADRLANITYPSGVIVIYEWDSVGRIKSVSYKPNATAAAIPILDSISYYPFGAANVFTFKNGRTLTKTYDKDYAIDQVVSSGASNGTGGLVIDATVDVLGNLINASNSVGASPSTQQYSYDPLYRLTNVADGNGNSMLALGYDAAGDRLSKTPQGQSAQNYFYASGTHHLLSANFMPGPAPPTFRAYDNNGNMLSSNKVQSAYPTYSWTYDDSNRMAAVHVVVAPPSQGFLGISADATYRYNGKGERVRKTLTSNGRTCATGYDIRI